MEVKLVGKYDVHSNSRKSPLTGSAMTAFPCYERLYILILYGVPGKVKVPCSCWSKLLAVTMHEKSVE